MPGCAGEWLEDGPSQIGVCEDGSHAGVRDNGSHAGVMGPGERDIGSQRGVDEESLGVGGANRL